MVWFVYTANPRPNDLSAVSCGNITISQEDTAKQISSTILSIVPPDEKTKHSSKHSLAISTSFGHVHAFLNDPERVWSKLDDYESKDQCLMLIKKPRSAAKQMLKAHSWANLSVSDSHLYSQLDGTLQGDTRKHHKYRMKRKQSDLQLVPERRGQIETWIQEQNAHLESRKTISVDGARSSLPPSKRNEINNNDVNPYHIGALPKNMVPSQRLFSSERNLSNLDCNSNIKSSPKRNESYSEIKQQTVGMKQFVNRTGKSKYGPPKPPRMEQKHSSAESPTIDSTVQYVVRERTHMPSSGQKHFMNGVHGNIQNRHKTDEKAIQNCTERYSTNKIGQDDSRQNPFGHQSTNLKTVGMEYGDVAHQSGNLMRNERTGIDKRCDKTYSSQELAKIGGTHSSENLKSFVPVQPYRESNLKKTSVPYSHYQNREMILRNSETDYSTSDKKYSPQQGCNSRAAHHFDVERRRQSEGNYRTSSGIQNSSKKMIVGIAGRSEEKIQNMDRENNWHNTRLSAENEVSVKTVNQHHVPESFPKGGNYKTINTQNVPRNSQHEPSYGTLDLHVRNQMQSNNRLFKEHEKNRIFLDSAVRHQNEEKIRKNAGTIGCSDKMNSPGNTCLQKDRVASQIKSDELHGIDSHGVISKQEDQEPVMRSHSMGDLTAGLTFSLVGQLKAESMLTLPASSCDLDQDGHSVPFSVNQNLNFDVDSANSSQHGDNLVSDSVTKLEIDKSVAKPRRSLPQAPGDAKQKKKRYTELMQMKIRSASSRNTHSSPQSSPEIDHNVNEMPLDQEVSDLLQQEDELGSRITPQELPPTNNNKNGRRISMQDIYTGESPQVRHLSGDSTLTTRASHGSTVDSGYLTNDQENDFYSTSSYTLSIQRSAQNIYSRVQDQNGVTRQVTPRQFTNDTKEPKSVKHGFHHYENCYNVSRVEPIKVGPMIDEVYSQNVTKHKRSSDPCISSREKMVVGATENTKSLTDLNSDAAVWLSQKSGQKDNVDAKVVSLPDTHSYSQYAAHRNAVHEHHFQPIRSPESSSSPYTYSTLPSNRQYGQDNAAKRDANSSVKNASLFLILQKYRMYPVRINLPKNCSLFEFVHLQDDTVVLPLTRNSPTDQLLTSTPKGKCATLGGPGSAFKPVRNKQSVTTVNMVTVAQVTDQLTLSCDVGELAEDDLIVELDGQLVIGANLTTLRSLIQRSGPSIVLTIARKCPEFSADVSVITESKDTMVLEQELTEMRQRMSVLTTELQFKDQQIQQLNASLPHKNYLFLQQNGSVLPTDSFLNGLDEDEFIV